MVEDVNVAQTLIFHGSNGQVSQEIDIDTCSCFNLLPTFCFLIITLDLFVSESPSVCQGVCT